MSTRCGQSISEKANNDPKETTMGLITFDRTVYFDSVRDSLFAGRLSQRQVDGQEAILSAWEQRYSLAHRMSRIVVPVNEWKRLLKPDLRHLAYPLSTTYHETSQEMWPIEEYGRGEGMEYGEPDPETGQTYFGRGYVQLTWRDNYARAARELGLVDTPKDLEWHAEHALDSTIAADVMFFGMEEGWFRTHEDGGPETLGRYFNSEVDDAFEAREIINGDKNKVPSWSGGKSIGQLCVEYHEKFLAALDESAKESDRPLPPLPPPSIPVITIRYRVESAKPVDIVVVEEE
jgi:hypothetical protein